jgi:hypothetical protein
MRNVVNGILCVAILVGTNLSYAICIKDDTEFKLHYTIENKNVGCPVPRVKFYQGTIKPKEKKCFAHSSKEGNDWKIYRKDIITIEKINKDGSRQMACRKLVEGILNTLEVDYHAWNNKWWCLDNSDYED